MLTYIANPARFVRLADRILPWSSAVAGVGFTLGLPLALWWSPPDYQQGDSVRIMYIHVPAAWLGVQTYVMMAVASAVGFVWKHPLALLSARAMAPVGMAFTALCLVTGALWGKPMWGAWWVWDARLTSMLVLLFLYMGYMALVTAFDDPERGQKAAAILLLVGVVNVPIIKYSVVWWSTLHQPASVFRMDGPTIAPAMLWPLAVMVLANYGVLLTVVLLRLKTAILDAKIRSLRQSQAGSEG